MLTTTTNLDVPAPAAGADATRIRTEADAILADSRFARSKVLSRLLAYLVDQTLAGTAGSLKSCTIAIEGLGRQDAQSADDDAYARVAIGRLRRAIDEYYAQAPTRPFRLTIDRGSYEVGLMAVDTPRRTEAAVSPVGEEGERAKLYPRVFSGRWLGFLLVVVAIGIAVVLVSRQREAEQWRTPLIFRWSTSKRREMTRLWRNSAMRSPARSVATTACGSSANHPRPTGSGWSLGERKVRPDRERRSRW